MVIDNNSKDEHKEKTTRVVYPKQNVGDNTTS